MEHIHGYLFIFANTEIYEKKYLGQVIMFFDVNTVKP